MSCPADDFVRTIFKCPLDDCAFSVGHSDIDRRTIFHFLAIHGHNFLACFIASFTTGCNQLSRRRLLSVRRTIFNCPSDNFLLSVGRFVFRSI